MKKLLSLLALIPALSGMAQQDAAYNLYQFNQMIINPGYAGARDGIAAMGSVRKQWVGFNGAPQTSCLSIHSPILKKNIGVGLTIINDVMGPRNVIAAYGNFAYILKIDKKTKLGFGLNAGYNRYQFNFSKINFKEGEVPSQLLQNQTPSVLDINGGLYLRSSKYFVGLSATHLNNPNVYTYAPVVAGGNDFKYRLKTHLFLTAGYSFIINKNLVFAPTTLIKQVSGNFGADLNLNFFLYKKIWLGAFYRAGYGPGGLLQYYISDHLRVAYSFDSGISSASRLGGSHEVMFGYDVAAKKKSRLINPRFL
jgi:type IX secretion system PorP/SprF family membrane protein